MTSCFGIQAFIIKRFTIFETGVAINFNEVAAFTKTLVRLGSTSNIMLIAINEITPVAKTA